MSINVDSNSRTLSVSSAAKSVLAAAESVLAAANLVSTEDEAVGIYGELTTDLREVLDNICSI